MPIYEYQCKMCQHQLEIFQKINEAPLTECPHCHQAALHKLISSTSFQLKGTGWYATDIRDKGKPKPTEEKKEEVAKDSKPTTEKSDNTKKEG